MNLTYITYHVFTNERDEWFANYKEALSQFEEWVKEFGTARLYEEVREKKDDEVLDENCLKSVGEYPM